ncbi:hypothetical protein J6590_014556 [Homalodisca vitripennis]|nr:hypothetical protein J6590_014556 [Homalodisca vitripennis]
MMKFIVEFIRETQPSDLGVQSVQADHRPPRSALYSRLRQQLTSGRHFITCTLVCQRQTDGFISDGSNCDKRLLPGTFACTVVKSEVMCIRYHQLIKTARDHRTDQLTRNSPVLPTLSISQLGCGQH